MGVPLRTAALLLAIACVSGIEVKRLGGSPEDAPRRTKRGEHPKERSTYVRRIVRDGDEIELSPGGKVERVHKLSGDGTINLLGLASDTEVVEKENRFLLTNNKDKKIKVQVKKNSPHDGQPSKPVEVLASGTAEITLESAFEERNFLVWATLEIKTCAVTEEGEVILSMATISVKSVVAEIGQALSVTLDGACATATYTPASTGFFVFDIDVQGTVSGEHFERTGMLTAGVVESLGEVTTVSLSNNFADSDYVDIKITGSGSSMAGTHRVVGIAKLAGFKENWHESEEICFAQHVLDVVVAADGSWIAVLQLHAGWISRSLFTKNDSFEIRELVLSHVDGYVVIGGAESFPVEVNSSLSLPNKKDVDEEMRKGKKPNRQVGGARAGRKLMLVHGYCSGDAWGEASSFTDPVKFSDFGVSRGHDDFALKIEAFGSSLDSFGIVAHSQGGAAALHLYAYYWSGLDYASAGRRIQSVGTPYQGTPLAGNLAALGRVFGVGCGTNNDLTYGGASAWLSGIPSWARADVTYFTTSFRDRWWWWYDYCSFATDMLLGDPDDGCTEMSKGQLIGAISGGHQEGWCHTADMRDAHQCVDAARNERMNRDAAR